MKSFKEWREENVNEIFGLFGNSKPRAYWPTGSGTPATGDTPTEYEKEFLKATKRSKEEQDIDAGRRAWCPFCIAWSAVEEDAYYPKGLMVWQCAKCRREWDSKTVERRQAGKEYEPGRGAPGIFLHKDDVKPSSSAGFKESLYLSGLISEEAYYEAEQGQQ